jgi:heme exporter protein C
MSPRRLEDFALAVLPWLTGPAMLVALYLIFMVVPTERDQGIVQRIFYFHVPSAWTAFLGFFVVCGASLLFLWRGDEYWDRTAKASAEVGMVFCTLVLLTGPIWARPIWGTWWTWDPRLTMTVILWTIYASYLLLRSYGAEEQEQISRYAAVLGIVGAIDIPLIVVSVRLWRGIHPAVMMSRDPQGGLRDPMMGVTLMTAGVAFALTYAWLLLVRMRWLSISEQIEQLERENRGR